MAELDDSLELSVSQARVLGALLEKEVVTPDAYPMTLNAVVAACNQASNRDPVLHLEASTVEMAALTLKAKGLARVVYPGSGERATKYRQVTDETLSLNQQERALICLLLLRGAQTVAELRTRTIRLYPFPSSEAVESVLQNLAERSRPLVSRVDRMPGQKEIRWIQLLESDAASRAAASLSASVTPSTVSHVTLGELESRIEALESRVEELIRALGDLVHLDGGSTSAQA